MCFGYFREWIRGRGRGRDPMYGPYWGLDQPNSNLGNLDPWRFQQPVCSRLFQLQAVICSKKKRLQDVTLSIKFVQTQLKKLCKQIIFMLVFKFFE